MKSSVELMNALAYFLFTLGYTLNSRALSFVGFVLAVMCSVVEVALIAIVYKRSHVIGRRELIYVGLNIFFMYSYFQA